jgi:hypothetical protein
LLRSRASLSGHARIAVWLAEIARASLHISRSHPSLACRDCARLWSSIPRISTDHVRIAISLAEIVRVIPHITLATQSCSKRSRAFSPDHARIAISLAEVARVFLHLMLASNSRLMRPRASLYWSRSHRNLVRQDRASLSTHHARIPISLAEIVRVSAVASSHRNLVRRDRVRLSIYHPRIPISLPRLCASLQWRLRVAISLAEIARVSPLVTPASRSRSPR